MRRVMQGRWMLAVAMSVGLGGLGSAAAEEMQGALQIKGSDTMVNLCQAWAEAFMARHPRMTVAVTGGGSGSGIAALISGTCDLAAASRAMSDKEISLARAQGHAPQERKVALDGIAVVVHPTNPVRQLTIEQLAKLFNGTIRNWKEVGGANANVILLSREVNSGTHVYFKEHVLSSLKASGGLTEFAPEALLLPSSQAIADEVASNPAAIGYYGMGYLNPKNTAVAIANATAGPYVIPTEETVRSGAYPISRPLLFYSGETPQGAVKAFLDFVMSPEGQQIVRTIDFVPVQ